MRASRAILSALSVVLWSCSPPADRSCIDGEYHLNGANDVHLVISHDRFRLVARNDVVTGKVEFPSGSSEVTLLPEHGSISARNRDSIEQELRDLGVVRPLLDAMAEGKSGTTLSAYQNDRVVLEVDYKSIFFWKPACERRG